MAEPSKPDAGDGDKKAEPVQDLPTSGEPAHPDPNPAGPRLTAPAIALRIGLPIAAVVVFALAAMVTGFAFDQAGHRHVVSRNVTLAGVPIDGIDKSEVVGAVDDLAARYRESSLVVGDEESTFTVPAEGVAFTVDKSKTIDAALDAGKSGNQVVRFGSWAKGFLAPRHSDIAVDFDTELLREAIHRGDQGTRSDPLEPTLVVEDGKLTAIAGNKGTGIDVDEAARTLRSSATNGSPIRVEVKRKSLSPRYSLTDAEKLASEVEDKAMTPLTVKAGTNEKVLDPATMRGWITTTPGRTQLEMSVDNAKVGRDLEAMFASVGTKPKEPTWTVVADKPVVAPGQDGTTCCDATAATSVNAALSARLASTTPPSPVDLALRVAKPVTTEADIPKLGINQQISSFTTYHPAGQPRVENIHRIADLVRGQVIKPGDTFSVNDFVGKRTIEKGFVVDHVIEDGKFAEAVGGGISQFATTTFNAAFFGGLDFGEYQAHTIYISRYPYGREATVAFPHPDLQIKNTTPYGVLIWPSYTATSLTVSLYSTPYATGEQTGQSESPRGACKRVTTERTRKYVDGRTQVDSVFATYQPEEGKKC